VRIGIDLRIADGPSGQQRYLWRLGRWLGDAGHDVHLLVSRHAPPEDVAERTPRATVADLAGLPRQQFRRRVRDLELDVLLLNPERSDHYAGIGANLLRPGYGTDQYRQKLRSFRNPLERGARRLLRALPPVRGKRTRERRFYEGTTPTPDVVAISDRMRTEVLDTYAVDPDRVHVVPNGVDVETFCPAVREALRTEARAEFGLPADALCILMVAHNYRLKGVRPAMDQVARLRAAGLDAHLLVAGRGTSRLQRRRAAAWARARGLVGATHLPGVVHPVTRAYAAADVFLHPTWHDAFGNVVLEAMACGLPPLTSPWAGAAMVVEDGVSGYVVDPAEGVTLHRRLVELADGEHREHMGRAARATAERHDEPTNFRAMERLCELAATRTPGPVR